MPLPAEGLVLKPARATYLQHRWQKMKRDYIPGLGDTVDLVLLGASWDAKRARELNGPSKPIVWRRIAC
jgi:DNA ligase-4